LPVIANLTVFAAVGVLGAGEPPVEVEPGGAADGEDTAGTQAASAPAVAPKEATFRKARRGMRWFSVVM